MKLISIPIVAVVGLLFLGGCENAFTPFSESGDREIVVTGFLDQSADSQFVRVQMVRRSIASSATLEDGLDVTLLNTATGIASSLTDSLIATDDGGLAHLFYTTIPIADGTRYSLTATSDAGQETVRSTLVPGRAGFSVDSVNTNQISIGQTIHLGIPTIPDDLSIVYTVRRSGDTTSTRIEMPYTDAVVRSEGSSSIEVVVRLENDRLIILDMLGLPPDDGTTELADVAVQYVLLSDEWDQDQPGSEDLNFFASTATFSQSWSLSNFVLEQIGYAVP